MTSYTNLFTFLCIIVFLHFYKSKADHELGEVIHSRCAGKKDCIVTLEERNYTLTNKTTLGSKMLERLAIVGKGYGTRILCKYNNTEEGREKKNVLLLIHQLDEVYLRQLHFHNCHPAKVIPLKNKHNCVVKNFARSNCPQNPPVFHPKTHSHSHVDNREFSFQNSTVQNRSKEFIPELKYISVNATVWIKNCNKVAIDYCSFNDFSYNAIQITDVKTTNISSLFLYKSSSLSRGYQARGILYEIVKNDNDSTSTLNIEHSFFEDIATLTQDSEFYMNISKTNKLRDVEGHYGGAGIKILILTDVRVDIRIKHCYFKRCTALQGGGLLLTTRGNRFGYNLTIEDSVFEWNQAIFQTYLDPSGGAILVKQRANNSSIQIRNTHFNSNCANRGGAIGIKIQAKNEKSLNFKSENNSFYCNNARNGGGAVYTENYFEIENAFIFDKSNFTKNSAENGGALFAYNSYIDLTDSNFKQNRGRFGGAIALISSKMFFNGFVTIKENVAYLKGGGLYLISFSKIHIKANSKVLVQSNEAFYKGGGIFVFNNYEENTYLSWLVHIDTLKDLFCFITFCKGNTSLEFSANSVKEISSISSNISRGSDLFVNTWGACWNIQYNLPTIIMNNATNLNIEKYQDGNSVATDIFDYSSVDLRAESLCYFNTNDKEYTPICQEKLINTDSFPGYMATMQKIAKQRIKTIKSTSYQEHKLPKRVYVIYPGFETSITIISHDESNKVVLTDTVIVFKTEDSRNKIKFKFGKSTKVKAEKIVAPSSTRVNFRLVTQSNEWINGQLCLISQISLRDINYCVPIILSKCLSGITLMDGECKPEGKYFGNNSSSRNAKIMRNQMMVVLNNNNKTDSVAFVKCKWFQCRCAAAADNCTFNILKPAEQCASGLKGQFCTQSENNMETVAQFYSLYYIFTSKISYECPDPWPWLTLVFYFVICAVILIVIISLKIDIFEDYTRSITFYSSILFLLTISCQVSENALFIRIITIPIVFLNLKVTHIYPFCFFDTTGLNEALFELYGPLTFAVYTVIIYLCIHYFSGTRFMIWLRLGKNNILKQFWTIIILLYTNMCGSAFIIFDCPLDSNLVRRWIFNGSIKCFVDEHLKIVIAAIFTLYILSIFPLFLLFTSHTKNNLLPVVWVYEKRYKPKYRHWEVFKLVLRFTLALTLIIPISNSIDYPCLVVSIICLLLMAVNSVLQPAENEYANHFESFCLLFLALVGIRNNELTDLFNVLTLVPYVLYIIIIIYTKFKTSKYANKIIKNITKHK